MILETSSQGIYSQRTQEWPELKLDKPYRTINNNNLLDYNITIEAKAYH